MELRAFPEVSGSEGLESGHGDANDARPLLGGLIRLLAPRVRQSTNRRGVAEPQVCFRIVHVAANGHLHAIGGAISGQTVEAAFGPEWVFRSGEARAVTRPMGADRV